VIQYCMKEIPRISLDWAGVEMLPQIRQLQSLKSSPRSWMRVHL